MFSLGDAAMDNLEESSLISNSDSPTCFVVEPDEFEVADVNGSTLLFQPGNTIELEGGPTAFLSANEEVNTANFHQIELGNGTTAFIALPSSCVSRTELEHRLTIIDAPICNILKVEHLDDGENIDGTTEGEELEYTLGLAENEETEPIQLSFLELEPDESNEPEESVETVVINEGSDSDETVHISSLNQTEVEMPTYDTTELEDADDQETLMEDIDEDDETLVEFPQKKASGKTKSYVCSEPGCSKKYTALHHLKVHSRVHTGDRPYCCTQPLCDKKFGTNYALKAHIRTHTGEKPYHCPEETCGKGFKTSGDLQKHIRTHTGERPFKCNVPGCNRSFTTSNIRKVHVRTHTGERPYECTQPGCGRAFASATNFKNHMRIHSGEKPYVCTVKMCGRRFTEYSSLYKHQTVHSQQKPYECRDCGRHYRQSSTLTMHRRTAHGIIQAIDGSEIVLSLPDDGGKLESLMLLELSKERGTLIPLNSNRSISVTSSSFARPRTINNDEDSNNDDDEEEDDDDNEDDVLMAPSEVIEDDDNSLRQIFVVSDDVDITYENFDALDSAVI